jgi:hypothetical protein
MQTSIRGCFALNGITKGDKPVISQIGIGCQLPGAEQAPKMFQIEAFIALLKTDH